MTTPDTVQGATRIRLVREAELPLLREIERASGEIFRGIGMAEIAEDEPLSLAELGHYQRAGRAWVGTEGAATTTDASGTEGVPVAFLLAEPVDGHLHIAQVSVHPAAAGRRLGAALIEHLAGLAVEQGAAGLTLTTYRDVPWNAPYYRRLGFTEIPEARLNPGLRAIRELERTAGLDSWPRLAMFWRR
ncbi:MAG TPA: GNAT family N-acetyltransferase [Pseudonocardia sp.]|nr:GNAT family N-acetyltransferase [Pseudonocardia sp.]